MNTTEYANLTLELTGKIFNKSFNGFKYDKDDMIQYASLNVVESINKYDSSKGDLRNYLASIIYNSYKTYIRDNVYRGQGMFVSLDENVNGGEEKETALLDTIGNNDLRYRDIEYIELMEEFNNEIQKRNVNKFNKINAKELHIIKDMLMDGYKQNEIAKKLNISPVTINRKINLIKDVILTIKNN